MNSLFITSKDREIAKENPLYAFMYALKPSEARKQYPKRLKMLFDYLELSSRIDIGVRFYILDTFVITLSIVRIPVLLLLSLPLEL